MILCARCEDAYHIKCIKLSSVPKEDFLCRHCKADMSANRQAESMGRRAVERGLVEECRGCGERVGEYF